MAYQELCWKRELLLLSPTTMIKKQKVTPELSSVQLLSCARLFVTLWTSAHQASLSITNSRSLLKLMSFKLVMPSNHFILCRPLLLLPLIFPSIRVFSNESCSHSREIPSFPSQLEWKIGLPWAYTRGILNSPS